MHSTEDHRGDREAGRLVYPVVSRRSGGLSLGINLFPEAKVCAFDCPYCEVFIPHGTSAGFSIKSLAGELALFLDRGYPEDWAAESVRDICLSGNGEPTDSPLLGQALALCASLRRSSPRILGGSSLVVITNSTGFLDPGISSLLERYSRDESLVVWAKLDAGNEELFRLMSGLGGAAPGTVSEEGTDFSLETVAAGLLSFARRRPVVIQTMLCEVEGRRPSEADLSDYAALLSRLVAGGARVDAVHLYTLARPSPGDRCAALSDDALARHAARVRSSTGLPVRAFGSRAEIPGDIDG